MTSYQHCVVIGLLAPCESILHQMGVTILRVSPSNATALIHNTAEPAVIRKYY